MNCVDDPMSEWDKLTGAEEEALSATLLKYWPIPSCDGLDGPLLINIRVPD